MADNSSQSGADTIATDDVTTLNGAGSTGVKVQRVKIGYGDDGSHRDASSAFPLPVVQAQAIPAGTNAIGTVALNAALPTGANQIGTIGEMRAATLAVSTTGAAATATTLTLPAAGAGLFHYITALTIDLYSTAARTGVAAPIVVTSTNLPGSLAWTFASAGTIGAIDRYTLPLTTPLKVSVANTATTIVGPSVTGGLWRFNVAYFTAT